MSVAKGQGPTVEGSNIQEIAMFSFEKLEVWQVAVEFANAVYTATTKFPDSERFGLTSQMRRASVSISSNIAEGSSRSSDKDFARFVEISYGSLMECVSQSWVACHQSMLTEEQRVSLYQLAERLARMLSGLRARLISDAARRDR
jgi:four helix bundle protein